MALTQNPQQGQSVEVFTNPPTIGLSTDYKPDDAEHGELFFESDTGDEYIYKVDGDTSEWVLYRQHFEEADTTDEKTLQTSVGELVLETRAVRIGLELALKMNFGDLFAMATKG